MRRHVPKQRKRTKPAPNWCGNAAIQLDFIAGISDNCSQTGANGATTPPPPNQDGGIGSTMTTANYTATPPRKTYPQDWPAYNAAQTSEKDSFMALLSDLCAGIPQPEHGVGRPRLPLADMVYTGTLKGLRGLLSPPLRLRREGRPAEGLHLRGAVVQLREPLHRGPWPHPDHHGPYRAKRSSPQCRGVPLCRRQLRVLHLPVRPLVRP